MGTGQKMTANIAAVWESC